LVRERLEFDSDLELARVTKSSSPRESYSLDENAAVIQCEWLIKVAAD
jgi:hypothetical protein